MVELRAQPSASILPTALPVVSHLLQLCSATNFISLTLQIQLKSLSLLIHSNRIHIASSQVDAVPCQLVQLHASPMLDVSHLRQLSLAHCSSTTIPYASSRLLSIPNPHRALPVTSVSSHRLTIPTRFTTMGFLSIPLLDLSPLCSSSSAPMASYPFQLF